MSGYIQYIFAYIQYIFRYIQYIFWYIKISFNKPKIILWAVNEGHHKRTLGISDFDPMELAEVWIIRYNMITLLLTFTSFSVSSVSSSTMTGVGSFSVPTFSKCVTVVTSQTLIYICNV